MDKDKLKFCRYYKGEEECPFKESEEPNKTTFWYYEKQYFFEEYRVPNGAKYWQDDIKGTAASYPDVAPFLLYSNLPRETKGLIAYMREDLGHMNPLHGYLCVRHYIPEEEAAPMYERQRKDIILKDCKFYKGEESNPLKGAVSTYWDMEAIYVKLVIDDEMRREEYGLNMSMRYPDRLEWIKIPFYLKATMYDQYYHWTGGDDGFIPWLKDYLEYELKEEDYL